MKKVSMRNFSLLGLVLIGASAVTAAVLPKNEPRKIGPGQLVNSLGPNNTVQKTCKENSGLNQCTFTNTLAAGVGANKGIGSRTSAVGGTSLITTIGGVGQVKTISNSPSNKNSSQSPA